MSVDDVHPYTEEEGTPMRISIEDVEHSHPHDYPPDLIHFQILEGESYHPNKGYIYGFRADGESQTDSQPLPWWATKRQLRQATWSDIKDALLPSRLRPPRELEALAVKIHATGVIDDRGALDGSFLPVTFLTPDQLAITKRSDLASQEAEVAILDVLAEYFGIAQSALDVEFFSVD